MGGTVENKSKSTGDALLKYCFYKYFSDAETDKIVKGINKIIEDNMTDIQPFGLGILHKILYSDLYNDFDKNTAKIVFDKLEVIYSTYKDKIILDDEIMESYMLGYNAYIHIPEMINDLANINVSKELKTASLRIPAYTNIIEGCLSNLFRTILLIINKYSEKDYSSQFSLKCLSDVIEKNGFECITSKIDIDIRNSISHGKYHSEKSGNDIKFIYMDKQERKEKIMSIYEFDNNINEMYALCGGIIFAITLFINKHENIIYITRQEIQFDFISMELSIPKLRCIAIWAIDNNKQLNIEFYVTETNKGYLCQVALLLAVLIYNKYNYYEQYMFTFSSERLAKSWVRFTNDEILSLYNGICDFNTLITKVIKRGDVVIWDAPTDNIDLNEVKYFRFPDYQCDKYIINNIVDASIENRKRLRANLYVGNTSDKYELVKIIFESIDWIKQLKNINSPIISHKYGTMEADSVYMNVYRENIKNKQDMFPSNQNFICFVDYNIDGITTLKNGGIFESIWKQYYHETIGRVQIAWNDKKFIKRLERNCQCPCGSGKKYKKCCGI